MQRVRRLRSIVSVAAVVGLLATSACGRSAPDIAAYVGNQRISVERVEAVYDDAQDRFRAAVESGAAQSGATASPDQLRSAVTRQDVANLLVSLDLGRRVAKEKRIDVPDEISAAQLARDLQVPPDAEYAKLWAEWVDLYNALGAKLPPAELSDEAVMAVYRALAETGQIEPGMSVERVRQLFGEGEFVRSTSAISAALGEQAEQVDLAVNPRFRPLSVPAVVGTTSGPIFYALPYVDETGPVTELTPSAKPRTAAAQSRS